MYFLVRDLEKFHFLYCTVVVQATREVSIFLAVSYRAAAIVECFFSSLAGRADGRAGGWTLQVSAPEGSAPAVCCHPAGGTHPSALYETRAAGGGRGGGVRAHVPVAVALCIRSCPSQVRGEASVLIFYCCVVLAGLTLRGGGGWGMGGVSWLVLFMVYVLGSKYKLMKGRMSGTGYDVLQHMDQHRGRLP